MQGSRRRFNTLSRTTKKHTVHGYGLHSQVLRAGKQPERKLSQAKQRRAELQAYSQEDRDAVEQMDVDAGHTNDDVAAVSHIPPPGEEGLNLSHEGGEYEAFTGLVDDIAQLTGYRRVDSRTRADRVEIQTSYWAAQMDDLTKAYLTYRHHDGMSQTPNPTGDIPPSGFTIEVLDTYCSYPIFLPSKDFNEYEIQLAHSFMQFHPVEGETFPNETLLRRGFLGCAPLQPTVAISIRTLELYRQAHRTCPRFSIEAQCKTLCHMNNMPYRPNLRAQFSVAYDAFLEICRRVDTKINTILGSDTPQSRVQRSCPACFYELQGEPDLVFSCLVCIDGNNSLKRLGSEIRHGEERIDLRTLTPDRWITTEEVDRFRDEVQENLPEIVEDVDSDQWEDIPDVDTGPIGCIERWKNAGPDERKKMVTLFEETGIFIASCRHRMVLAACDMVKSGELMKYPLAITNRLIQMFGSKIGCAYDIGCAFVTTLHNSSLREYAQQNEFHLMVGAFHGHAHNRACQLQWHPTYIQGTGHTEGEGCEQVFSSSNDLARASRHATRFHRHQMIEEHFKFWDEDKYANLSQFLGNHYRAALDTIFALEHELQILKENISLTEDDFHKNIRHEMQYLEGLKKQSPIASRKIQYIQALQGLEQAEKDWDLAHAGINAVYSTIRPAASLTNIKTINQARRNLDFASAKLRHAQQYVATIEIDLDIDERWTKSSPEYQEFYQEHVLTNYSKAVDNLERLVVMRLFELTKMSSSGTGYKLRRQISKALQRRSEAIKKALKRYNTQAALLNPPRPPLSWKEIVDYSFIGEFDLLRHSREDIRLKAWAQPSVREATVKFFKLCRAKEELARLNVEMRRLRTWIHDEHQQMTAAITDLSKSDPSLSHELQHRWALRSAVNDIHLRRLDVIENLSGFTGIRGIGLRQGYTEVRRSQESEGLTGGEESNTRVQGSDIDIIDNEMAHDDFNEHLTVVTDFMLTIN